MKSLPVAALFILAFPAVFFHDMRLNPRAHPRQEAAEPARNTQKQPPVPDTRAGARLADFLDAMNSKDTTLLRKFVEDDSASASPGAPPPAERLARLQQLRDDKAPFTLLEILDSRLTTIVVLLKDRHGEQVGLRLDLDASSQNRVVRLRLGNPMSLRDTSPVKEVTRWQDLRDLITQIQTNDHLPAMAIAVSRVGKPIEQAVVGIREQGKPDRVQIDDRWHIGSIGKAMTSTLIALLIDRGALHWDTTIGEALPDVRMNPDYRQVTLEQLLQHRGGIPQDMGFRADYIDRITKDARTPTECRAAYIADVLQRAPIGRPGERMAYSNAGYTIAGYIAERVTGKPYEQLMRERVFLPLGMTTAKVGGGGDPGQPQGHMPTPNGLQVMNFTGILPQMTAPAGDITCSIGDLARFAAFHLAGMQGKGRLLKPETFRRLHTPPPVPPGQERYACGWEIVTEWTPEPFQGHGGSNGTFRAQIALFPKLGLAAVAATNAGGESDPSPPLQAILAVEKRMRSTLVAK